MKFARARTLKLAAFAVLIPSGAAGADSSTYTRPTAPAAAAAPAAAPAAGAGTGQQFQTPAGARPNSSQEMLQQAKDRLSPDQYKAFEEAMKKIDAGGGSGFVSEPVIDGANIPLQIIFKNGQVQVVGQPVASAPPLAAPAPPAPDEGAVMPQLQPVSVVNPNPGLNLQQAQTPAPAPAAAATGTGTEPAAPVVPEIQDFRAPAATAPKAVPAPVAQQSARVGGPPLKGAMVGPPAPPTVRKAAPPALPPPTSALGFPQPGKAAAVEP